MEHPGASWAVFCSRAAVKSSWLLLPSARGGLAPSTGGGFREPAVMLEDGDGGGLGLRERCVLVLCDVGFGICYPGLVFGPRGATTQALFSPGRLAFVSGGKEVDIHAYIYMYAYTSLRFGSRDPEPRYDGRVCVSGRILELQPFPSRLPREPTDTALSTPRCWPTRYAELPDTDCCCCLRQFSLWPASGKP